LTAGAVTPAPRVFTKVATGLLTVPALGAAALMLELAVEDLFEALVVAAAAVVAADVVAAAGAVLLLAGTAAAAVAGPAVMAGVLDDDPPMAACMRARCCSCRS